MAKAIYGGVVLAESDTFVEVEGNVYFPEATLKEPYFKGSDSTTWCAWKGRARYYDVVVGGVTNHDAAWYYPEPKDAAKQIKGHVAFWRGVLIER